MSNKQRIPKFGRRETLQGLGVASFGALAGCVGGNGSDDGEDETIIASVAPQEGLFTTLFQGLAATVSENSDWLSVEVRPAPSGSQETVRLLDEGELDIAFSDALSIHNMVNDEGAYSENPISMEINQFLTLAEVQATWLAREGVDLESVDQFDEGYTISWGIEGAAFHSNMLEALGFVLDIDDVDGQEVAFGDLATQLDEGNIDAATNDRIMKTSRSPYIQQLEEINQNARLVEWPEDAAEQIQESDRVNGSYYEPNELAGEGQDAPVGWDDRDELFWIDQMYNTITTSDFNDDIGYEFMNVLWNNKEEMAGYHQIIENHYVGSDFEFFTSGLSDSVPVQPGVQKFYDEIDV